MDLALRDRAQPRLEEPTASSSQGISFTTTNFPRTGGYEGTRENLDWGVKIDSGSSSNRVHCKSMAKFLVLRGDGAFDVEVRLRDPLAEANTRVLSLSLSGIPFD